MLLDIFLPDPAFLEKSHTAVREAFAEGSLVICEPVYAELASRFASQYELDHVLNESQIRVEPVSRDAAFLAGQMFSSTAIGLQPPSCSGSSPSTFSS